MTSRGCVPVNITAVLASHGKVSVQFDAGKDAFLPLDLADEAHDTMHPAGNVNRVADGDILAGRAPRRRRSHAAHGVTQSRKRRHGLGTIGDAGERAGCEGG